MQRVQEQAIAGLAFMLLCIGGIRTAWALELKMAGALTGEYSDNIRLDDTNKQDDWVRVASVGMTLAQETSAVSARVSGQLQYRDYAQDVYDDETLGTLNGLLRVAIVPNLVSWSVEDYFDQAAVDAFAPQTPENRQNANAFSTGPDLKWRVGPVDQIEAGLRYSDFYYEKTDVDNTRRSGNVHWRHRFSPTKEGGVMLRVMETNFVAGASAADFTRSDGFLRGKARFGTAEAELAFGGTHIQRQGLSDLDGPLARLEFDWSLSEATRAFARAYGQYSDTGYNVLFTAEAGARPSLVDEQVTGDVFYDRNAELGLQRTQGDLTGTAWLVWRKEDFEELNELDRRTRGVSFDANYQWSVLHSVSAYADYRDVRYLNQVRKDRDLLAGTRYSYRLSRSLSTDVELSRQQRNSSIAGADYTENRFMVTLRYGRIDPRAPLRQYPRGALIYDR